MTIEWNKVTRYSKIAAVVLFVGTFFLGFWLGTMKAEKIFIEVPYLVRHVNHLASNDLSASQNLTSALSENIQATTTFVGYYSTRFEKYGEEDVVLNATCEEFIVKKSNDPSWKGFEEMIEAGNTVNKIDPSSGDLLLNIDTSDLDPQLKAKILRSSRSSPLALQFTDRVSQGKGASPCYSFVNIVGIETAAPATAIMNDVMRRLTVIDPVLHWSTPILSRDEFAEFGSNTHLSGVKVTATSTVSRGGKNYEWTSPYSKELYADGWNEDTGLETDGPNGGMAGFQKNDERVILEELVDDNAVDSEGLPNCPCEYTYTIFVGGIKP